MMKQVLMVLLFLTGVSALMPLAQHKYYLIQQSKTWYDAQTYCRATYTDLATISSDADMARLQTEAQMNQFTSDAWVGLYKQLHGWRWSYRNESLGAVKFWSATEPDNVGNKQECARFRYDGIWNDRECGDAFPFVCYDERNTGTSRYVYISNSKNWLEAQRYCRLHHTDLTSVKDATEHSVIHGMILDFVWIGLSRVTWKWSDQTSLGNITWRPGEPKTDVAYKDCGYLSNFQAADALCSNLKPFFCHRDVTGHKQILRFKVQSDQNMNDPAVQAALLEKIQQKLKERGVEGNIKLKWREQPGGEVFQMMKGNL